MLDLTWRDISGWLFGLCVLVAGWFSRYVLGRIESKAEKSTLQDLLKRMDEAAESRRGLHDKIDQTMTRVDAKIDDVKRIAHDTAVEVGELRGQIASKTGRRK